MKSVQFPTSGRVTAAVRAFAVTSAAALLVSCSGDKVPKEPEDAAAMTVNGKAVTHREIDEVLEAFRWQQRLLTPERIFENESGLRRGAARQLASSILILEDVKAHKWEIPAAAVDSIADGIIARFGGREAFKERLASIGETEESMRRDIADGILLDSMMAVRSAVDPVGEEEARAHFEANRARYTVPGRARASHIVFTFDPANESPDQVENIMKKANEALAKAKAGANFELLVKEYSSTQAANGDMGWFRPGELTPDLESALFPLKTGEISGLTPSGMGIHILKKTDEEAPRQMEFEEADGRIRRSLELMKRETAVNGYIDSLLSRAKITFADTTLDFTSARASSAPERSD